ncbi:polysaccharide deacetylase family protein [Paenibacillus sp. N3.4]|nr:polysaccharide deacetylase family protein [Paenibacillus sp. N3.4]
MAIALLCAGIVGCAPMNLNATASSVSFIAAKPKHEIAIPVLSYHSIGVEPGNTYVLPPDVFLRQMDDLAAQHYTPLTLEQFMSILEHKQAPPLKPVLLTFDDGYANNAEVALPILKRHGFPATLFLSTGAVGQPGYVSWKQVQELAAAGWDIMPHGMTHPHLPQLSIDKQREEIKESRHLIEQQLGHRADVFAYPYGEYNEATKKILKDAGFRYGFTTQEGWASSDQSPLELKRLVVHAEEDFKTWIRRLAKR